MLALAGTLRLYSVLDRPGGKYGISRMRSKSEVTFLLVFRDSKQGVRRRKMKNLATQQAQRASWAESRCVCASFDLKPSVQCITQQQATQVLTTSGWVIMQARRSRASE